jgi:hypothetical protein
MTRAFLHSVDGRTRNEDGADITEMSQPTLLVMAAGIGSRYGGLKQIDPIGPSGETIVDYSVFDALRAGFGHLVFVIRHEIEAPFREAIGSRFERRIPVDYVFQELDDLPKGFSVSSTRQRPWGTGQAVLAAEDVIHEPFAAINADDFYGRNSFRLLADHLRSETEDYAMVGFALRSTLSDFGPVTRGICDVGSDGCLRSVTEIAKIQKDGQSAIYTDAAGVVRRLAGDETVSMSMWGFKPTLFAQLHDQWIEFLSQHHDQDDSEWYIPTAVSALVESGRARCRVLPTTDSWFGVTHRQDRQAVAAGIRRLIALGTYPEALWR